MVPYIKWGKNLVCKSVYNFNKISLQFQNIHPLSSIHTNPMTQADHGGALNIRTWNVHHLNYPIKKKRNVFYLRHQDLFHSTGKNTVKSPSWRLNSSQPSFKEALRTRISFNFRNKFVVSTLCWFSMGGF